MNFTLIRRSLGEFGRLDAIKQLSMLPEFKTGLKYQQAGKLKEAKKNLQRVCDVFDSSMPNSPIALYAHALAASIDIRIHENPWTIKSHHHSLSHNIHSYLDKPAQKPKTSAELISYLNHFSFPLESSAENVAELYNDLIRNIQKLPILTTQPPSTPSNLEEVNFLLIEESLAEDINKQVLLSLLNSTLSSFLIRQAKEKKRHVTVNKSQAKSLGTVASTDPVKEYLPLATLCIDGIKGTLKTIEGLKGSHYSSHYADLEQLVIFNLCNLSQVLSEVMEDLVTAEGLARTAKGKWEFLESQMGDIWGHDTRDSVYLALRKMYVCDTYANVIDRWEKRGEEAGEWRKKVNSLNEEWNNVLNEKGIKKDMKELSSRLQWYPSAEQLLPGK